MKKIIYLFAILAFSMSCSSQKEEAAETTEAETPAEEESVFSYSNSFEMGDQATQDMVRTLIDTYAEKDWEALSEMMADSVLFYFASGTVFNGTKEELLEMSEEYLKDSEIDITYLAAMPVNEINNGHTWALFWTAETQTKDGESTTEIIHQSFLLEDGKLASMRQFKAEPIPADAGSGDEEPRDYTYSGSFTAGDPANVDLVVALNDAASQKDMETIESLFADSVTIVGESGFYFNGTRDSLMIVTKEWLESIAEMSMKYNAGISVTATDRSEDWVLLWYEMEGTNTEGETRHQFGHDDYQIENGKIRVIRSYEMKIKEEGEEEASAESDEAA